MKNRPTLIFTFLFTLLFVQQLTAQDAAVIGWNSDTPDGFAVVALVDIPSTQNIFVTDEPWNTVANNFDNNVSANEGTIRLTWTGTWTKGTIIRVVEDAAPFTVTSSTNGPTGAAATIVYGGDGFSLNGSDGLSVFTSNNVTDPNANPVEVYSYLNPIESSSLESNPSDDADCPCSSDFVELDFNNSGVDGGNFNPALRGGAVSLTDVNTAGNWVTGSTNQALSLTEFANLTFGGSGVLLPVDLVAFTATLEDRGTLLDWQTASEENNDYFQVERSLDGRNFFALDQVDGNGSTILAFSYSYVDPSPAMGKNYYRLKQVDFNGAFEYSKTVAVDVKATQKAIRILPNPTSSQMTLSLNQAVDQDTDIAIYTLFGQIVLTAMLEKDQHTKDLDLSTLSAGTYLIKINTDNQTLTQQVVKL